MRFSKTKLLMITFLAGNLSGFCPQMHGDEVLHWNSVALTIMQENATHPPKVGRDLAIVHIAAYDALMAIKNSHDYFYFHPSLAGPSSPDAAIAAAAHQTLVGLYPAQQAVLDAELNSRLALIPDGPVKTNGLQLGQTIGSSMLGLRSDDGWDDIYDYQGSTDVGMWRPTPPGYESGLAPNWGKMTPFCIPDSAAFMPGPPPALDSPEYAEAFNEVKLIGGKDSLIRTPDQDEIAEFWNDFPGPTASPPGKWNIIGQVLAEQQGNSLMDNARMFALLNATLADAGIVCWDAKYTYELWRPEDAIRLADTDGNAATEADLGWVPNWPSPPFPEYTSGHSTFSGSAAAALRLFFGTDDIAFEVGAGFDVLPGVTRSYDSLSEAALEAGMSRIYGGIHFQFANIGGLESGENIGAYVCETFAQVPEPAVSLLLLTGTWMFRRRSLPV